MNFVGLIKVELSRMFRAPATWFFFVLTALCPLLGYQVFCPIVTDTTAAIYLGNPFIVGGIGASFLFGLFGVLNLHRVEKNHMEGILYSICSPVKMHWIQVISLLLTGLVWDGMVGLFYAPYTSKMLPDCFAAKEYVLVFLIYWAMARTISLLLAATFYNMWKRADAAIISVAVVLMLGLTAKAQCTCLSYELYFPDLGFSSDFGNVSLDRIAMYSRGVWLLIFAGAWLLSMFGIRIHGKNWLRSMLEHLKKAYWIAPAILLIGSGTYFYRKQPYIYFEPSVKESLEDEEENETWTREEFQEEEEYHYVLSHTDMELNLDCKDGSMSGRSTYTLENQHTSEQECSISLEPGFQIEKMKVNGKEKTFWQGARDDGFPGQNVSFQMPSDQNIELEIQYSYYPQMISSDILFMDNEITPEYISLGNVAPSLNKTMTDDSQYTCKVKMPKKMELIVGGLATSCLDETQGENGIWRIEGCGVQPQIFAGDYVKLTVPNVEFPVHFYYGRNHQKEFESIDVEQMLQDTIDYCTRHFGSLPYTEEYPLSIVVASAHMMGGAALDNLSYMGENCFSSENLKDLQKGANAREVIAHEIIHQWWGIHVPIMDDADPCWTGEAFTCYTTYRLMKELYGEEYAYEHYVSVWQKECKAVEDHFYVQNPQYQQSLSKYNQNRLESMIDSADIYAKGPLELKMAEKIVGEERLDEALRSLFEECQAMNLFYISKQDFLDACEIKEDQLTLEGVKE